MHIGIHWVSLYKGRRVLKSTKFNMSSVSSHKLRNENLDIMLLCVSTISGKSKSLP